MTRTRFSLAAALLVAASCVSAPAQVAPPQKPSPKGAPVKPRPAAREGRDESAAGRRALAVSLLTGLAEEARGFRDEVLRARVEARAADALWEDERERDRARDLFRRAWESAALAEKEFARGGGGAAGTFGPRVSNRTPPPRRRPNVRSEILRLAAQRDHALVEELLARLAAEGKEAAGPSDPAQTPAAQAGPTADGTAERLRLANELLEVGDHERALQIAGPAIVWPTERTIGFLIKLREKNAAAADARFAALLARAEADPAADANTASLLTSYALTPSIFLTVSPEGHPSSMSYAPRPAPDLAPDLRAAFFRVAAGLLLRPAAELERTSAGRAGTYFIVARLLPFFEQHAPAHAARLRTQLAALRTDAPAPLRAGDDRALDLGMADAGGRDRVQDELDDRLARATDADARDRAYAFAAMKAASAGEMRARDFVGKITDGETRRGLGRFTDYELIGALLRKDEAEEAAKLARKSDLPPAHLSWALTRAAAAVAKTDRARAVELLDESLAAARRIESGGPERAYSFAALASGFAKVDRARAREVAGELIKAANAVADFTGEDGHTQLMLEGKFSIQMGTELASPEDLPGLFAALAGDDLFGSIETSRTLTGEAPRSLATLAIARAVLEEKPAKASR